MPLRNPERAPGRKNWCGPTALAVLTGRPYLDVYERMVKAINRDSRKLARAQNRDPDIWVKSRFAGVSYGDLVVAGKSLGVKIEWKRDARRRLEHAGLTLLTFVRDHTVKGKTYLVVAGNHYVVVRDGVVYDNTPTGPHPIDSYPRAKLGRLALYAVVKPRPEAFTAQ